MRYAHRLVATLAFGTIVAAPVAFAESTHVHRVPKPTPQCASVPCGGSCEIFPSCPPQGPCPDFVIAGTCTDDGRGGCSCVPAQFPTPTPTPVGCVDTVLCIRGSHWSPEQCRCVPDRPHPPHQPHAPHAPSVSVERGCRQSGGRVTLGTCCASVGDFPNTCVIGACGCGPGASHTVRACACGAQRCFDGTGCVRR